MAGKNKTYACVKQEKNGMTSVLFFAEKNITISPIYYFFLYICRLKNNPFVVVWIVLMQPQLSKTVMIGK